MTTLEEKMLYLNKKFGSYIAPWWKIVCAKLFGVKRVEKDLLCSITTYTWRGTIYATDIQALR